MANDGITKLVLGGVVFQGSFQWFSKVVTGAPG